MRPCLKEEKKKLGSGSTHKPLVPALERQRQVGICQTESSLVYRASSRTAKAIQKNPALEGKKTIKEKENIQGEKKLGR